MIIVVGGKEHREGTSKAGRKYDFNVIYFMAPKRGVTGQAAIEKIVDRSVISFDDILVGQAYEIETDLDGNVTGMLVARE